MSDPVTRPDTILKTLRRYESRNVTFIDPDGSWPIVWARARGMHVWDTAGRQYLDLTAAFGVAAAGHANRRVVRAGRQQMSDLLHAMGDVHPHPLKARLARELSRLTFERWASARFKKGETSASGAASGKVIFCNSGFEAVEAALKTALLATGKPGVIAFHGAYHGVGYGTLSAMSREHFVGPFRSQLAAFGEFVSFPTETAELAQVAERVRWLLRRRKVGAVLVEPVQARGGMRVPPPGFLPLLRRLCDEQHVLLVLDEVFTGFGRTGAWFACEHSGVVPDLICLGKALTGGFPLSACVGRAGLMDEAWPESNGEAIHTSTYLGHPVGCAMALAQISEIRRGGLVRRSAVLGKKLITDLRAALSGARTLTRVRGLGLMVGVELSEKRSGTASARTFALIKRMLQRGYILLPEGEHGNVVAFTPPLIITPAQLTQTIGTLSELMQG